MAWLVGAGQVGDHRSEGAGTPLRARRLSAPVGPSQMGTDRHWLLDGSATGEGRTRETAGRALQCVGSTGGRLINSLWCNRVESYDRQCP